MAPPPSLLSPSELSYLHTSLSLHPPIRPDARSPTSFRPLVAETDLLPSANGSARLCFADGTEAIVGVKAEIEKAQGVAQERCHDEDPLFNDDWNASSPLYPSSDTNTNIKTSPAVQTPSRPPITLLVISVGENVFFDASRPELAVADAVLAVTVTSAPPASSTTGLNLLAVRTIDPPSRLSAPAAEMPGQAGAGIDPEGEKEGVWRPRKGGVKRGVLRRMVQMCVEGGGVGEEVLGGLGQFIG
ncbi:MAG: Exosome complex component RRP42 [Alectoria sarmentosa]|nr:MAG: Exosome complex component RRP42 [Alectoria sarmentosa]CAD6569292.1 MAG: Exosome complex component RRP42 [Alectoria sarmentosa]